MPLIAILVLVVVLYLLFGRSGNARKPDEDELEARMLHLCVGDAALVERLVQAEVRRAPGISRLQAMDRAYAILCRSKN